MKEKKGLSIILMEYRQLGLIFFILVLSIGIQMRNTSFLTAENLNDMLVNTAILSILAIGMMLVIITRGIDLSIGSTLAMSGMITSLTVFNYPNTHPFIAMMLGIAVGTACGAVVGLLVAKAKVPPIIASLGMMNVFRGLTYIISGSKWVSAYQMPDSFKAIATGRVLAINNLLVFAFFFYIIFYYFINHTRMGRQIYAVGSNPESAVIVGFRKGKIQFMAHTIMGTLAGFAGVLWVSKFASAQGDTATGYEMSVIAACVLGGVSISGGAGKISGILLGSLLLGILNNALPLLMVSPFWQSAIQGVIILIAILTNVLVKRGVDNRNLARRKI